MVPADDMVNAEMIYNRHDLSFHDSEVSRWTIGSCTVFSHTEGAVASLGVFGRVLPASGLDTVISDIFQANPKVLEVRLTCMGTDYHNLLISSGTWIIDVPKTAEDLESRIGRKGRYNMRRAMQNLSKDLGGELEFQMYGRDIPDSVVKEYFALKALTHGKDYGLTARQYLEKYFVTGAMRMGVAGKTLAVLFYCENNGTVFLENISYDTQYAKWSPGILLYHYFLGHMVEKQVKRVFLGGGNYAYKERFGSVNYRVYSGRIYRSRMRTRVFSLMNKIRHYFIDRANH